jgi:REP element-mobilizing transposase RayT
MATENVQQLFSTLKQNVKLRTQLASLKEGDWDGVVKIAQEAGFHFTKEELMAAMPDGFFKGKGKNPDVGWRKDHQMLDQNLVHAAHTIWATYHGQPLFQQNERGQFKSLLFSLADQQGVRVIKGKVEDSFIYLHLQYPLHLSLGQFIESLRAQTSVSLKEKLPDLEQKLNKTPLWDPALDVWSGEEETPHRVHLFKQKFQPVNQSAGHSLSV